MSSKMILGCEVKDGDVLQGWGRIQSIGPSSIHPARDAMVDGEEILIYHDRDYIVVSVSDAEAMGEEAAARSIASRDERIADGLAADIGDLCAAARQEGVSVIEAVDAYTRVMRGSL